MECFARWKVLSERVHRLDYDRDMMTEIYNSSPDDIRAVSDRLDYAESA